MAINNDIITLEVKVKASDAHSELNKLQKDLSSLRDELTAAGKSSDEFTKDERYRALIERINELHGALKKQNSEYAQSFKTNEQTFMELIKARFKEESASLKELEQLRRHLRAKQSGTREGSEDWQKNIKELAEVENKIEKIKDEIKQVKNEMKLDGSIFKSAETIGKASLNQLRTAAQALQEKLDSLSPATIEFIETSQRLALVKSRLGEVENAAKETKSEFFNLGNISDIAGGMTLANLVDRGLGFIKNTMREAYDATKQYQSALSDMSAITGASGVDLENLKNRADSLTTIMLNGGIKITNSAEDILKAFKLVGSAKPELLQDAEALQEVTKQTIILSKATGMELPEAVQYATTILNQFEAPASDTARYINAIAAGAKEGASEIPDIAASIKEFGAGAASANVSIEESVSLVETLGDKMIKGGEAGTMLRNILLVIKAPEALDKKALEALQAHNVNTQKLADTNLTLKERLSELSKIANDAGAMVNVFGKENITAAEILLRNIGRFDELNKKIADTNEAYRQASAQTNNLSNLSETLDNNWKRLTTTMGEDSDTAFKILINDLNEVIDDVIRVIDPVKQATQEHKNLSEETSNLTQNIKPLLTEYDNLINKGSLNTAEQARLEKIVQQVSLAIPAAITQFNDYGQAIAISTDKARLFIETQVKLSAAAKSNLINALKEENAELNKQIDVRQRSLETGRAETKWFQLYRKFDAEYIRESTDIVSQSIAKRTENLQRLAQLEGANAGDDRAVMLEREDKALDSLNKTTLKHVDAKTNATDKNKKHKDEIVLLAGTVAFLKDQVSKLNKEFENAPETKTVEIAKKMATATKALADAEDKLEQIRTEALKKAFGRTNFDDLPQIETLNVVEVQKKIKGRQEANDSGNAQTIKSISPEKNQDVLLAKAIADIELDIKKRGHQKKYEEEQKYQAKIQELIKGGLEATRIASDAIFQIQAQNSEYRKNEELKRVEDIYKKRLDKAKGNTKETVRLEKELDDKRRQIEKDAFERDKKRSIIQAIMNGAMAITKILAEYPKFDFGIATAIGIGLAAATTAAQVAVISNQKFEKGGVVRGASHTEGGIKLFDTKSKSIVGEMEGDEPYLILSKNTYKNNKDIIDALIDSSQNRNGASVMANGGIVQPNATATAPIKTVYTNSTTYREPTYVVDLSQMAADVKEIKTAFESFPREFKGYIVYQDLKDNQDIVEQVKNKAFGR